DPRDHPAGHRPEVHHSRHRRGRRQVGRRPRQPVSTEPESSATMSAATAASPIRVLVWGENVHEQVEPHVAAIYPDGMHATIADAIAENLGERVQVTTTTLQQ